MMSPLSAPKGCASGDSPFRGVRPVVAGPENSARSSDGGSPLSEQVRRAGRTGEGDPRIHGNRQSVYGADQLRVKGAESEVRRMRRALLSSQCAAGPERAATPSPPLGFFPGGVKEGPPGSSAPPQSFLPHRREVGQPGELRLFEPETQSRAPRPHAEGGEYIRRATTRATHPPHTGLTQPCT